MAVLSEEQEMLRNMAREWVANESPVAKFRAVRAGGEPRAYDPAAYATMAQMGWTGVIIPEAFGGYDFGWLSAGMIVEELGKTVTASPLVATTLAAAAIVLGGSDEQKARWLPQLASGAVIGTLAIDEGPHHNPRTLATTVAGGALTGTKAFVHEAHDATLFVVAAADGLYLVEGAEGTVDVATRHLADMRSHAQVTFSGAAAQKLEHGGDDLLDKVLDRARILTACEMLGMAQQVFDTTLGYLKQRVQFNQVLSSFQALQHRMADLFGDLAMMRSAVEGGLQALDSGVMVPQAAALAKAEANRVLHTISREGVQLHGGIGMTDEYDIGFYLKRARVLEASWGTTSFLKDRFATLSGY
ncbi:MAG: acyl-CoA dehydrogenase [Novosphingobium sp. 17-62-19]|uniref:acyl-CoA dehydrogenase family protein n=1 Tax=Novosphingobium sp. 17-62-19 TaxID=1970406 RepID=UPI000BCBE21C|nr:acyl-CoA dehydrogenase family protein [Novosphingobium sp. 17-62-19]OZA21630.1 MAG: acyl-CoA dehydrogenase [Novosphingobium sp. 17-62-19]HQS96881.1 acyl-CoA dehydrogenase family protein [Novosphingobium sp.]